MEQEKKMSKNIFINCEQAGLFTTINEIGELTSYQKIQLGFHNLVCKICKLWAKQSVQITLLLKKAFEGEPHKMCEKKKAELEKDIDQLTA